MVVVVVVVVMLQAPAACVSHVAAEAMSELSASLGALPQNPKSTYQLGCFV